MRLFVHTIGALTIASLLAATSYALGFSASVAKHGSILPFRANGACVALDQDIGQHVGTWPINAKTGRCEISDFLWSRILK